MVINRDLGTKPNCILGQILVWSLNASQPVFLLFNAVTCFRVAIQIKELMFVKCFTQYLARYKFSIMVDRYNKDNSVGEAA